MLDVKSSKHARLWTIRRNMQEETREDSRRVEINENKFSVTIVMNVYGERANPAHARSGRQTEFKASLLISQPAFARCRFHEEKALLHLCGNLAYIKINSPQILRAIVYHVAGTNTNVARMQFTLLTSCLASFTFIVVAIGWERKSNYNHSTQTYKSTAQFQVEKRFSGALQKLRRNLSSLKNDSWFSDKRKLGISSLSWRKVPQIEFTDVEFMSSVIVLALVTEVRLPHDMSFSVFFFCSFSKFPKGAKW